MLYEIEKLVRAKLESPAIYDENDVILASFPKSGNTWFRFLVANINYLNFASKQYEEVSFQNIANYSPEIRGNRALEGKLRSSNLPVFLKTHFPATPYFNKYKKIVLFRTPKKTINSYYHYLNNEKGNAFTTNAFLKHWRYGYKAWNKFHESWLKSDDCIYVQYEDLLKDTEKKIIELYRLLGYDLSKDIATKAVSLSSRENMATALRNFGDPKAKNKNYNFVTTTKNRETAFADSEFSTIDKMCGETFTKLEIKKYQF